MKRNKQQLAPSMTYKVCKFECKMVTTETSHPISKNRKQKIKFYYI